MTRNLKTLGLALVAALALSAVVASGASAASASFTANVGANEQAEGHGEQGAGGVAGDTFTLAGLPPMTCGTVTETGFLEEGGVHKKGSSSSWSTGARTYGPCHIVLLFVTRTMTIKTNGCTNTLTATKNTGGKPFTADLTVNCPTKPGEIHVYNTSNPNDTSAAVLCTYDLPGQTFNDQIELTNNPAATPDDVIAHINTTVSVHNKILSGTCSTSTNMTAIYKGTHTLRATNEAGVFVDASIS